MANRISLSPTSPSYTLAESSQSWLWDSHSLQPGSALLKQTHSNHSCPPAHVTGLGGPKQVRLSLFQSFGTELLCGLVWSLAPSCTPLHSLHFQVIIAEKGTSLNLEKRLPSICMLLTILPSSTMYSEVTTIHFSNFTAFWVLEPQTKVVISTLVSVKECTIKTRQQCFGKVCAFFSLLIFICQVVWGYPNPPPPED